MASQKIHAFLVKVITTTRARIVIEVRKTEEEVLALMESEGIKKFEDFIGREYKALEPYIIADAKLLIAKLEGLAEEEIMEVSTRFTKSMNVLIANAPATNETTPADSKV